MLFGARHPRCALAQLAAQVGQAAVWPCRHADVRRGRGADSKDSKRIVLPRAREHLYMPHCRGGVTRADFYA